MKKNLTSSSVHRQNILNNPYALQNIQKELELPLTEFEGEFYMTKQQIVDLFEVDGSTVDRYISENREELSYNGYILRRGKDLYPIRLQFAHLINKESKTTQIALFSFRAVLNLAMLLQQSERAKVIRSRILDITLQTLTDRAGGNRTYINQRDPEFLLAAFSNSKHRKDFTTALNRYVDMGPYKYAYFTEKMYEKIFHENSREYRKILNLESKENPRDSMYAEVLQTIASFEAGFAHELKKESERHNRKLTKQEAEDVMVCYAEHPQWGPYFIAIRTQMASRDMVFRDALHFRLQEYIKTVSQGEFERFLDKADASLVERIQETRDVFIRLRDK